MPYHPRPPETNKRESLIVDKQVSRIEFPNVQDGRRNFLGSTRTWIDAPQRPGGGDEDLRPVRMPSDSVKTADAGAEVSNPRGAARFCELNDEALSPEARPLLRK